METQTEGVVVIVAPEKKGNDVSFGRETVEVEKVLGVVDIVNELNVAVNSYGMID